MGTLAGQDTFARGRVRVLLWVRAAHDLLVRGLEDADDVARLVKHAISTPLRPTVRLEYTRRQVFG